MNPKLTPNQFLTFLLLYAAHVDYNYDEKEEVFIKNKTDANTYQEMHKLFHSNSDYQCLKIILGHKNQYYKSECERQLIYNEIIQLLKADGDYSRAEKVFLEFFKRMIKAEI